MNSQALAAADVSPRRKSLEESLVALLEAPPPYPTEAP